MNKKEILETIIERIEGEVMRTGSMGTEMVSVDIYLNDKEIEMFHDGIDEELEKLEGNYHWEVEGNVLSVCYTEADEVEKITDVLYYLDDEESVYIDVITVNGEVTDIYAAEHIEYKEYNFTKGQLINCAGDNSMIRSEDIRVEDL